MIKLRVIGDPIEHSRSPEIHRAFAEQTGLSVVYDKARVTTQDFDTAVDAFRSAGGRGLNITLPLKTAAARYADQASAEVIEAEAANTLSFTEDGAFAFNTDGVGLVRDLAGRYGIHLADQHLIVLGAGGAVRGVVGPLLDAGVAGIVIANRTEAKAHALVQAFAAHTAAGRHLEACSLEALPAKLAAASLVINGTSSGHHGGFDKLPADLGRLPCYDLSYGAAAGFARWAQQAHSPQVMDGLGMLVEQAAESFRIWTGQMPETEPVYRLLRAQMSA